jgi:hypothetical protein
METQNETNKEFIIWGKDQRNKDEYPLYTKCKNEKQCLKVMEILTNKYKCYDLRIQIIDYSNKFDFAREVLTQ